MTPREADLRQSLAEWLTSHDNALFGKSMANRTWSYFFGRGIIEPVDDIRASNPAVNPELLDALNKDFVESGYDLKHMMRVIVMSRTYQSSIASNVWNVDDKTNFSHALPRRLEAQASIKKLTPQADARRGTGRARIELKVRCRAARLNQGR